jgi:hypothetical protein
MTSFFLIQTASFESKLKMWTNQQETPSGDRYYPARPSAGSTDRPGRSVLLQAARCHLNWPRWY